MPQKADDNQPPDRTKTTTVLRPNRTTSAKCSTTSTDYESEYALPRCPESSPGKTLEEQKRLLDQQQMTEKMIANILSEPTDMEIEEPYIAPKKISKLAKLIKTPPPTTATSNTFEPLATEKTAEEEIRQKTAITRRPKTNKRNLAPPPIVIRGNPKDHRGLVAELRTYIKKGFTIKYARRSIILYLHDHEEYKNYKKQLIDSNETQFHTYSDRTNKTHAFVLRGLCGEINPEEIKEDLEQNNEINIKKIYKMKTKYNDLYLVITGSETTLKKLQTEVRAVLYTKVSWERRTNERVITQCRRCQAWGHATSNCYHSIKCVKCAGPHWSKDCDKPQDSPPKCTNCNGEHTAANTQCPVYLFRVNSLAETNKTEEYTEAPPPEKNVWDERRKAREAGPNAPSRPTQRQPTAPPPTNKAETNKNDSTSPRVERNSPPPSIPTSLTPTGDFELLLQQMRRLNSLINLKNTIRAIKHLNDMLEKTAGPMDVITTLQEFTTNILPTYDIYNSRP